MTVMEKGDETRSSRAIAGEKKVFVQRLVKGRTLRVALRLGSFSGIIQSRGAPASCSFQSHESGSRWCLTVDASPADHLALRLAREVPPDSRPQEHQFVKVRLTAVVGCFSSSSEKRRLHFQSASETHTVMRLKKRRPSPWQGLACLPADDALTIRCEITEFREAEVGCERSSDVRRRAAERRALDVRWRDSYVLSVPAIEMSLA